MLWLQNLKLSWFCREGRPDSSMASWPASASLRNIRAALSGCFSPASHVHCSPL